MFATERPSDDNFGGATCAQDREICGAGIEEGPANEPSGVKVMNAVTPPRGVGNVTNVRNDSSRNNDGNVTINACVDSSHSISVSAPSPTMAVTLSRSAELRSH